MLRLFAALPVPEDIAQRLTGFQRGVPGAKWRPVENFHITIGFFGDLDEAKARDLDEELGQIETTPFDIRLKGGGWFGGAQPTSLIGEVSPWRDLEQLHRAVSRAARRTGVEMEKRRFHPHVTLAYCKNTPAQEAAHFTNKLSLFQSPAWPVDHFAMFSSLPSKKGPNYYREEAVYPLLS